MLGRALPTADADAVYTKRKPRRHVRQTTEPLVRLEEDDAGGTVIVRPSGLNIRTRPSPHRHEALHRRVAVGRPREQGMPRIARPQRQRRVVRTVPEGDDHEPKPRVSRSMFPGTTWYYSGSGTSAECARQLSEILLPEAGAPRRLKKSPFHDLSWRSQVWLVGHCSDVFRDRRIIRDANRRNTSEESV